MDIGAIGMLAIVIVYMALIAFLLNKRFGDLGSDFSGIKSDLKAVRDRQDRLIASVEWLMAKSMDTSNKMASPYQDPQSDDD